jgi:TolA-binding protein
MSAVADLHPEELLDRSARGELSAPDRARLDAHVARCAACRFELQLRADFADELGSDVTPSSVERLTLASASQPRARTNAPAPGSVAPPALRPRRRATRATWLLVAAAVFAVSVAGANAGQRTWSRLVGLELAPGDPAEATPAPPRGAKHVVRHPAKGGSEPVSGAPAREEARSVDVLAPPVPAPAPPAARRAGGEVASLFDAANDARRRGDYGRALQLQRELASRFPQSREAHVGRATLARLLLDRGDPGGALGNFDAYLAQGSGELGEEAMVGRATALERLGRTRDARGAWEALLAAYPGTPYAAHAKARLGSSSAR